MIFTIPCIKSPAQLALPKSFEKFSSRLKGFAVPEKALLLDR